MKSVEIGQATRALCDYTREAHGETLVVTRRGRPVAAVVPLRRVAIESLSLATNPDFGGLIVRARSLATRRRAECRSTRFRRTDDRRRASRLVPTAQLQNRSVVPFLALTRPLGPRT